MFNIVRPKVHRNILISVLPTFSLALILTPNTQTHTTLQFPTEELVKEVENSIAEFKRQNQEYDEERVKDQVEDILEGAKVLEWLREHADVEYICR